MQGSTSVKKDNPSPASLVITKSGKQQLTKNQQAFNKLTQKIERLQKEIENKQIQLDLALKMYATDFSSARQMRIAKLYDLILALFEIYKSKKLSDSNQRQLKILLQDYLQEYRQGCNEEPDEAIQAVCSRLEGMSYEKIMQREKEQQMEELKNMFSMVNVDIEGADLNDPEVLAAKMQEASKNAAEDNFDDFEFKQQRKANQKKNSAKQENYEKLRQAAHEAKQKNISTIYRQLAKLFHPDLEQDVELKAEKEILMKQLTTAYENKNLHALLMLELKWIHKETDHLHTLTEEKLAVYLQVLKDQVNDLQAEKRSLIEHPQYAVLVEEFGYDLSSNPVDTVKYELKEITFEINMLEKDVQLFNQPDALKHVNSMLKYRKQQQSSKSEEEEILQMLFGMMGK